MTRFLFVLAFALGATAVIWVGLSLPGSSPVALIATLLIAVVYGTGFVELLRFRQANGMLCERLQRLPSGSEALDHWLASLPAALRGPVHRRIEGEPAALPGPSLTPYLTGLLVMLGLLGTFIGMIVTLRGAVTALEGGADLHAIRGALAAPIAGMSLAFGTSIAGVAASAMLGLAATLSRRDRMLASRELDSKLGEALKPFSLKYQRQETYQALQSQAQALPAVVDQLQALAGHMDQMGVRLSSTLIDNQQQFHDGMSQHYQTLAHSVADTLKSSLTESTRLAAESTRPIIDAALTRLNEQVERTHQHLNDVTERQLGALGEQFRATTEQAAESWRAGLDEQRHSNSALVDEIDTALGNHNAHFQSTTTELLTGQQTGLENLVTRVGAELSALRDQEAARSETAANHLADLEDSVARHLASLGRALEEPMTRLIETASETPKAAAEVITRLREEMGRNSERDNELLDERRRIMTELDTLLGAQSDAATTQREAIERLIRDSSQVLTDAGQAFSTQVTEQAGKLGEATAEVAGGAHEIASLSDAFATAVQLFSSANDKLVDNLQRIETALRQSSARSDEQLAYYVEQAREVIDLSLASQKDVLDALGILRTQANGSSA